MLWLEVDEMGRGSVTGWSPKASYGVPFERLQELEKG
jgi:hypothetical protein